MRITVVSMELPYPPNHGGRVDIWRRLQVLSQLGVEIQLVCWAKQELSNEVEAELLKVVKSLQLLQYCGKTFASIFVRLFYILFYPLEISSRVVYGSAWKQLKSKVNSFNPDLIMVDQLHGCLIGKRLSKSLKLPLIFRSHNIEHVYYRNLYSSASGFGRLLRLLSMNGLARVEESMLKDCDAFYDISKDDLQYWHSRGFHNGRLLPPLMPLSDVGNQRQDTDCNLSGSGIVFDFDVVFLGNLNTENNVAGIAWFISEVVPIVKLKFPNLKILISGSNPSSSVVDLCSKVECVELWPNPESASEVYRSGRVLINPMAVGGGVSIKAIDMLAANRPIVTLPKGVYGLSERAQGLFYVACTSEEFADKVCLCLSMTYRAEENYELIAELFGRTSIEVFLKDIKENVLASRKQV